jgi:hypothetical protein
MNKVIRYIVLSDGTVYFFKTLKEAAQVHKQDKKDQK